MSRLDAASIVLLVAVGLALVSGLSSAAQYVGHRLYYDDSPAIVFRNVRLIKTVVAPGEALAQAFEYSKRVDCHPPGGSSEINFRLWRYPVGQEPYFEWLDYNRPSRAPAGQDMSTAASPSIIPIPVLAPGNYALQWRANYTCANASKPQTFYSPILPFNVLSN